MTTATTIRVGIDLEVQPSGLVVATPRDAPWLPLEVVAEDVGAAEAEVRRLVAENWDFVQLVLRLV